ncbi:MAG: phosphate signaling complex protein PhoU [Alphaproteobacteria bacterium]
MSSHIVHSYDKDLSSLTKEIVEMGLLVKEILILSNNSLQNKDLDCIDKAEEIDTKINNFDEHIEAQAIKIIALRQPMAVDLRQAVSALKLAVIMERMGDLCKNTTKRAAKIDIDIDDSIKEKINKMTNLISFMLDETLSAYKENNDDKARPIAKNDEEVDLIYYDLLETLKYKMTNEPESVPSYSQVMLSIKNIERIGDYTVKIANMLIYIVKGERVPKISKRFT